MNYEDAATKYANAMLKKSKNLLNPGDACSHAITEIFYILNEYHPKALRTIIEELELHEDV